MAFADAGSLAQAATIVGRMPSAITAQIKRLEGASAEFSIRLRAGTNGAAETLAGLLAEGMKFER